MKLEQMKLKCPTCSHYFTAQAAHVGLLTSCPSCGQQFTITSEVAKAGRGALPFAVGTLALVLGCIYLIAVIVAPGSFGAVMVGSAVFGLPSFGLGIFAIAKNDGRGQGITAVLLVILAVVYNTMKIGRF